MKRKFLTFAAALFAALLLNSVGVGWTAFADAPEDATKQSAIRVSTVDEFLAAIAPDTEIILEAAFLDFSTATGYGETSGNYYTWKKAADGPELVVHDVSNLTIRAEGTDILAHTLSSVPRYAHVICFENCSGVTLEGFTAGHTKEPGYCVGGVIGLRNSQDIWINRCGLYGCGVVGIWAEYSKDILVTNSDIYECSWGGVYMLQCRKVTFEATTFRDLGTKIGDVFYPGANFMLHETEDVTIDGIAVERADATIFGN